jgi:SAM-dependent methyltransferase
MAKIYGENPAGACTADSVASTGVDISEEELSRFFSSYPRSRPPLSERHQRIYLSHYLENREGSGALTRLKNSMEAWMHRRVASHQHGREVLEIGAGTLNHLRYEPDSLSYDAVEPFRELWEGRSGAQLIRNMYESVMEIPREAKYDRIFSIAVLEHLTDLPRVVAEAGIRLRPDGIFQAGIASEGGVMWELGWRLSTAIAFRVRTGLAYEDIMRHEHVSTAGEILAVCRWLFEEVRIERFPTALHHLSFYAVVEAHRPYVERCRELLQDGIR